MSIEAFLQARPVNLHFQIFHVEESEITEGTPDNWLYKTLTGTESVEDNSNSGESNINWNDLEKFEGVNGHGNILDKLFYKWGKIIVTCMFRDSQVHKAAWMKKESKQDYQLLAYLIPINSWYLLQASLYLNVTAIETLELTHILVHITRNKLWVEFNTPVVKYYSPSLKETYFKI